MNNPEHMNHDAVIDINDGLKNERIMDAVKEVIAEYGFAIQGVFHPGTVKPSYLYTVGLTDTLGAEVIVVAEADIMALHPLINSAVQQAIANDDSEFMQEYGVGTLIDGVTPMKADFVEVTNHPAIPHLVVQRVGDVKRVFQLSLADENNLLPGEEGYNEEWVQDLEAALPDDVKLPTQEEQTN